MSETLCPNVGLHCDDCVADFIFSHPGVEVFRHTAHLPCDGPKTLNGLITEALENLPDSSVCLKIGPYRLEVLQLAENRVKSVRIWPASLKPTVPAEA